MDMGINSTNQPRPAGPQRFPVTEPNAMYGYIPDNTAELARTAQAAQAARQQMPQMMPAIGTPPVVNTPTLVPMPNPVPLHRKEPIQTPPIMMNPPVMPQVSASNMAPVRRKEPVQTPPIMMSPAIMPRMVQPTPQPQQISPSFSQTMTPPPTPNLGQSFNPTVKQSYDPSINLTLEMENVMTPQATLQQQAAPQQQAVAGTAAQTKPQQTTVAAASAAMPCYGEDAKRYADTLKQLATEKYRDCLYYSCLAKRTQSPSARHVYCMIARDDMCNGRKLAAAYFLITGTQLRFSRCAVDPVCVPCSYAQALRDRYIAESASAAQYQSFAASVTDPCLKRLAQDIADDDAQHAQLIMEQIQCL